MAETSFLSSARADGERILATASANWNATVPDCPGWNAADLVGHLGGIYSWMARIVTTGEAVDRKEREVPPEDLNERATWYRRHLDTTITLLGERAPSTPTWTFSSLGVHDVGWWWRRVAVETAIHRFDAEHGAGIASEPLDAEVAAAGIEEFLVEFLPGMLGRQAGTGLDGSFHLHATDRPVEWSIDLGARGEAVAVSGHAKADTALRGSCSDLLLFLTNRRSSGPLEIIGRTEIAEEWCQLHR